MILNRLVDSELYILTAEDIFEEEIFDTKDCMIDYALTNNFVKRSDNRLSQDNFTYSDWSLGIYDKARNLLEDPVLVFKREAQKKESLDVYVRKISTYEHYKTSGGEIFSRFY